MRRWVAVVLLVLLAGCGERGVSIERVETTPEPTPTAQAPTPSEAIDAINARVDVPVALPRNLPAGTEVKSEPTFYDGGAQLALELPDHRILSIAYGRGGFDGCGPTNPKAVSVHGIPAVINQPRGSKVATLVWPATLKDLEGRYAVAGEFTRAELLGFARSMERSKHGRPRGPKRGC